MTSEPQRLQYLSAMGVTAWVARYRLPNAQETPACDWPTPMVPETPAPSQRLHALLDEVPARPTAPAAQDPSPAKPLRRGKARAMLGVTDEEPVAEREVDNLPPITSAPRASQQALRFSLQIAALEGRWLVLLPHGSAPDVTALRLLANLLGAAGIHLAEPPVFQAFQWPMMEELPVEAPLDEARDGLRAFLNGRRRGGWRPERVMLFGESPALAEVLAIEAGRCDLLQLPAWHGPSLADLGRDAAAKRALLPLLREWRAAWLGAADESAVNEVADE
ncbi:hypothetical protein [Franzmannia qiaohouensis]|uniref:Uncharacterized protein n=1 Tax=Franzmannia qiaohouensis TaxID=1329370 RepID=A0ABU1HFP8_9GAMM|nr:hypothetical protein [Halomonas qiaohouensis]MDR5906288.1 hypothetical protein [Halomonas qiaohouensis]